MRIITFFTFILITISTLCLSQTKITDINLTHNEFPKAKISFNYIGKLSKENDPYKVNVFKDGAFIGLDEIHRTTELKKIDYYIIFNGYKKNKDRNKILDLFVQHKFSPEIENKVFVHANYDSLNYKVPVDENISRAIMEMRTDFELNELTNLCSTNPGIPKEKAEVIFAFFKNPHELEYNSFINYCKSQPHNSNTLFVVIVSKNKKIKHLQSSNIPPLILMDENEFGKIKNDFNTYFTNWIYNKVSAGFTIPDYKNLISDRHYKVTIQGNGYNDDAGFSYSIPEALLHARYEKRTLEISDSLTNLSLYKDALEYLLFAYDYPNKKINSLREKAGAVLLDYGNIILSKQEPTLLDKYHFVEGIWSEHKLEDWYYAEKENLFFKYFQQLDSSGTHLLEKVKVADSLFTYKPENKTYQTNKFRSYAELEISQGDYWTSVGYYSKYLAVKNDGAIENIRQGNFNTAIQKSYSNSNYNKLYNKSKPFENSYVLSKPINRFYFAEACYYSSDFTRALKHYEYIINNWKDSDSQGNLSWQHLIKQLQSTLSYTFDFDKSIALNRSIYLNQNKRAGLSENSRAELSRSLLKTTLLNLRLKYLKPVLDLYPKLSYNKLSNTFKPSNDNFPKEITAVAIVNKSGNIYYLYKTESLNGNILSQINSSNDGVKILYDNKIKNAGFINKTGTGTLVIQVSNDIMDATEKNMFETIYTTSQINQVWNNLYAYEENKGLNACSQLLTLLIGEDLNRANNNTNDFWETLAQFDYIKYAGIYNQTGSITHQGLPMQSSDYPTGEYNKSSKAVAFYKIELKKENQNIIDITNPVYGPSGWEGAVRFGFIKKW